MSPVQFIVLRQGGKWSVRSKDLERSFSDQLAAERAAVDLANHSGKNGTPGVVIVELAKGSFETIWTYGQDAYPPTKSDLSRTESPSPRQASEIAGRLKNRSRIKPRSMA